jgi:hypothetical protein
MMEASRTSETSVDIQLRIRQYIPEDSELQALKWLHVSPFIFRQCKEFFCREVHACCVAHRNNRHQVDHSCLLTATNVCMKQSPVGETDSL